MISINIKWIKNKRSGIRNQHLYKYKEKASWAGNASFSNKQTKKLIIFELRATFIIKLVGF